MMKKLFVFFMGLFMLLNTLSAQKQDLIVDYITSPDYSRDSVTMAVVIKNVNPEESSYSYKIKVTKADVSYNEAVKKASKNGDYVSPLDKGTAKWMCKMQAERNDEWAVEKYVDYDEISFFQSKVVILNLGDYWPYDPNCCLKVEVVSSNQELEFIEEEVEILKKENPNKTKKELLEMIGYEFSEHVGYFYAGG